MPETIKRPPRFANPRPSVRYSYESWAISFEGNCAIVTEISRTIVHSLQAWLNAFTSRTPRPSGFRNAPKLREARLQAVSSRNMYSEQGLDARIWPLAGQVCQ